MVERMTSVEIEDVLSSIRRLVTDDLRPKPVADSKLILTPALRVVPDVAPVAESAAEDVLDVDLDADLNAALAEDTDAPDADVASETFPMFLHHDRRVDLPTAQDSVDVADTVMTISAGIPADDFEAELGDVMAVPEWPEASWVAPDVIDVVEEAELIAPPEAPPETADNWLADQPAAAMLADDDEAEAAALAALAEAEVAQDAGAITELDEDMLRDIVRDIIREELQGTLGEKITRNVRKLVRAEINRALMTQDLA